MEGQARPSPLALMSSKSWLGHSESGAGMVGIAHAVLSLQHSALLGITHLKQLNPYVMSNLQGRSKHWSLPRSSGAVPAGSNVCGVSSFAFQGTNAHALVRSVRDLPSATQSLISQRLLVWERQQYYALPPIHVLAPRLILPPMSGMIVVGVRFAAPQLGYLRDCKVMELSVFPGECHALW